MKSMHPLSLQFWSWFPSIMYQGLWSALSSLCAKRNDAPSPASAISPVTRTKSMLSSLLIAETVWRRSSDGFFDVTLMWTSVTTAKRKGSKACAIIVTQRQSRLSTYRMTTCLLVFISRFLFIACCIKCCMAAA